MGGLTDVGGLKTIKCSFQGEDWGVSQDVRVFKQLNILSNVVWSKFQLFIVSWKYQRADIDGICQSDGKSDHARLRKRCFFKLWTIEKTKFGTLSFARKVYFYI